MDFRKATINDVRQLVELRKKQLIDEGSYVEKDIDEELEKYFFFSIENEALVVWIASQNGNIIATCGVCFFQYPPTFSNVTGKVAYITNVYTLETYRKQGIATKLLELIMEEIMIRKYKLVRLHALSQGKSLYEKIGFIDAEGFMIKRL